MSRYCGTQYSEGRKKRELAQADRGLRGNLRGTDPAVIPAMTIISFRDLVVWQRAMILAERVYGLTEGFPHAELYGLTSQLRRCAVSIPSNIAEGQARKTGHYLQHLDAASGSAAELQTQLELSFRLKLVEKRRIEPILAAAEEVGRMLHGLAASVAASQAARNASP